MTLIKLIIAHVKLFIVILQVKIIALQTDPKFMKMSILLCFV